MITICPVRSINFQAKPQMPKKPVNQSFTEILQSHNISIDELFSSSNVLSEKDIDSKFMAFAKISVDKIRADELIDKINSQPDFIDKMRELGECFGTVPKSDSTKALSVFHYGDIIKEYCEKVSPVNKEIGKKLSNLYFDMYTKAYGIAFNSKSGEKIILPG